MVANFRFPGVPLILAIVLAAVSWGAAPSLIAILVTTAWENIFALGPHSAAVLNDVGDNRATLLFAGAGAIVSLSASRIERARRDAEAARHAADHAARRATALQAVTAALSGALTATAVADVIITRLTATLGAAVGSVAVLEEDGTTLRTLGVTGHPVESLEAWREFATDAPVPIAEAIRARAMLIMESDDELLARYPQLATTRLSTSEATSNRGATLVLPLVLGNQVLGAIGLSFPTTRRFDADEQGFIQSLGELCAQALDRARLHDEAYQARQAAERSSAQLHALQAVTDTALACLALDDLPSRLLERVKEALAVDDAAILLVDEGAQELVVRVADGPAAEAAGQARVPLEHGFAERVAAERAPLIVHDARTHEMAASPLDKAPRSLMGVPLVVADRVLGVMQAAARAPRRFTEDDLQLMQRLAERVALALDHATLYRAERAARAEAKRRMDEFLMIASHELRTPLTVALGNVQLAAYRLGELRAWEGAQDAELARRLRELTGMLERTDLQMGRLTRLSTELLDLSRIEAHHFAFELSPCDLTPLLGSWVHNYQSAVRTRTITLELAEGPEAAIGVLANVDRLEQVVANYISNALKYSPDETPIAVSLGVQGDEAVVRVRDGGPGLSAEEQEHIWERFYRAARVRDARTSTVGLGLGLYISKTIVEQHNGRVGVVSAPGAGATFWFALPLARRVTSGE
jgi:K+-sensing histidine kinase KdpD